MKVVEKAVRQQIWARAFLMGPTSSGKSRGAFELASRLYGGDLPIALVNTERDRGTLYADRFDYALVDMSVDADLEGAYAPERFVEALDIAEGLASGGVIIVDSVTHEWNGKGGVLSLADRFGDWKQVRPRHNDFITRLLACQAHVIVCCRAKMKYEVTEEEVPNRSKPRQVVTMLGVGPVQDDSLQYEFNLVGSFDVGTHDVRFTGHVDPLQDTVTNLGDPAAAQAVADTYTKWLAEGTPIEAPAAATEEDVAALVASLLSENVPQEAIDERFAIARRENRGQLHPEYVERNLTASKDRIARKAAKKAEGAAQEPAAASAAAGEGDAPVGAAAAGEAA